jgi:hypothetical protein
MLLLVVRQHLSEFPLFGLLDLGLLPVEQRLLLDLFLLMRDLLRHLLLDRRLLRLLLRDLVFHKLALFINFLD